MADVYKGKQDDRRYKGEQVDITYSVKRCIHAEFCVKHLNEVFDINKRPWIDPNGASADNVAEVIEMCPSGALHYDRHDDKAGEATPTINRIIVRKDEYLQFIGDLEIRASGVEIESETRAALCRCGASENKPFCDNAHRNSGFTSDDLDIVKVDDTAATSGKLIITPGKNGPIEVSGNFQIEDDNGKVIHTGSQTWLCRCGGSTNKPFCDGTHNNNGFTAE